MLSTISRNVRNVKLAPLSRAMGGHGASIPEPLPRKDMKALAGTAIKETGVAMKIVGGEEVFSTRRPLMHLQGKTPIHANDTFISPSASVIGDVEIWDTSSIWYSVVVRGDFASVRIGAYTNIMDKCVVRTVESLNNGFPSNCVVGNYCSVGAGSVLTSCTIGNEVIIGEGCVISEGSVVSSQCILEPGTVLPPYSFIPANEQWGGSPAQFQAKLDSHAGENAEQQAKAVAYLAAEHYEEYLPTGNSYKHLEDVVGNVSA